MNKFLIVFLVVVAVVMFVYFYYFYSANPIEEQERRLRADVYGGETPEETLKLFVKALRDDDPILASKYFAIDDNGSRKIWEDALLKAQQEGRLQEIADEVESARPNPYDSTHPGDFKYVVFDEDGGIKSTIYLELNKKSGIWKIEDL